MSTATYVQDGKIIDHTPSGDVAAGTIVVIGKLFGVAQNAITDSTVGSVTIDGVFDIPKKNETFTAGAGVFWDSDGNPYGGTAGTGAATKTQTDNVQAGFAIAAAAATDTTVRVKIAPAVADSST
jgi:predicted RecA/RadA family phage recombinase